MTKVRQDAWSHEDDVLLAETVLKHIRESSTQLKAFEEVGDILNRTAAACGFRWNAVVRDRYEKSISEAKRERKTYQRRDAVKAVQRTLSHQEGSPYADQQTMNLTTVIAYLKDLQQQQGAQQVDDAKQQAIQEENNQLQTAVNAWKYKHDELEKEYQSLLSVINRARNMMFMEDTNQESLIASSFRMDHDGNLEQLPNAE